MRLFIFLIGLMIIAAIPLSVAQAQSSGNMQQAQQDERHIRITADRPAIVQLDRNASSVIVGNPAHATAALDSATTLIINPVQPGATSLIVLDSEGQTILEKQLLINAPQASYMRINRICSASTRDTCRQTSVYYCQQGCHEIVVPGQDVAGGMAPQEDVAAAGAAEGEAAGEGAAPPPPPPAGDANVPSGPGYVE